MTNRAPARPLAAALAAMNVAAFNSNGPVVSRHSIKAALITSALTKGFDALSARFRSPRRKTQDRGIFHSPLPEYGREKP